MTIKEHDGNQEYDSEIIKLDLQDLIILDCYDN